MFTMCNILHTSLLGLPGSYDTPVSEDAEQVSFFLNTKQCLLVLVNRLSSVESLGSGN